MLPFGDGSRVIVAAAVVDDLREPEAQAARGIAARAHCRRLGKGHAPAEANAADVLLSSSGSSARSAWVSLMGVSTRSSIPARRIGLASGIASGAGAASL